jgi:DNA uptake protein ComE-like DNA-binding protein
MKKNTIITTVTLGLFLILGLSFTSLVGAEMKKSSSETKKAPKISAAEAALQKERKEAEATASDLTKTQREKLLELLNKGGVDELEPIEGISSKKARQIVASRPFDAIEDVVTVKGIGSFTFAKVVKYGSELTRKK